MLLSFLPLEGFGYVLRFLETEDRCSSVVRPVFAFVERAGQHKLSGRRSLEFYRCFAVIESKESGRLALLAGNTEVPTDVDLGPMRNPQKFALFLTRVTDVFAPARDLRTSDGSRRARACIIAMDEATRVAIQINPIAPIKPASLSATHR